MFWSYQLDKASVFILEIPEGFCNVVCQQYMPVISEVHNSSSKDNSRTPDVLVLVNVSHDKNGPGAKADPDRYCPVRWLPSVEGAKFLVKLDA
jgi:hypothetical protein